MPCTKAEFVAAINSYAAARQTGDGPLVNMAATALNGLLDSLTFGEPEPAAEGENTED